MNNKGYQENQMVKVMLIEDDLTMVSLLSTLLAMEGFSVRTSESYLLEDLISDVCREQPELAFVDVNLDAGSGLDLVREIRRVPDMQNTHILMSSGLSLQQECILAGADGFLQKPFMPDELIKLIRSTIQSKKY